MGLHDKVREVFHVTYLFWFFFTVVAFPGTVLPRKASFRPRKASFVDLSTLRTFCINYFGNRKVKSLHEIKQYYLWIIYETDCSNCAVKQSGLSKRSLKSHSGEHRSFVKNCDCIKNQTVRYHWETDHNFSWNQEKVMLGSRSIHR